MQQPAAAPVVELVRWQTATLVASAVAAVELVLLVVLAFTVLAPTADGAGETTRAPATAANRKAPAAKPKPEPVAASLPRSKTSILVLNGNGVSGAAADTATRVERRGYRVGGVGNAASSGHTESLVMYRRGRQGEAERLARDLGVKLVAPLDGMSPRELGRAHVVLVVGG